MKKMIGFVLLCLMFFLYIALGGCDNRSEKAKMAHKAVYNVAKTLNSRNQLHYIGLSEAADEKHYKEIGLHFELFRIVSKDEARKILVDSVEELLKEINSNPQLQPYLQPSPFTVANIEIVIFIHRPDGKYAYHPDLGILSVRNGNITYSTDIPEMENKFGFYTEEKESYENALKIVKLHEAPNYFYYSTTNRVDTPQNSGLGMTFVNGIGDSKSESVAAAKMFSDMANGHEVLGVHNESFGIPFDLIERALGHMGIEMTPSRLIKSNWNECWANGNRGILHLGHGQGMIHTRNAISSYDKKLRDRIYVIGIAPAAHIREDDFGKAVQYESKKNIVPLCDKFSKILSMDLDSIKHRAPVVMLSPHLNAPWFDHYNDSPTYKKPIRERIQVFFRTYGVAQ